jgi:hypothetical protein
MKHLLITIVAIVVTACATEAEYKRVMENWIGDPETELVSAWGVPDRVHEAEDGGRLITYDRRRQAKWMSSTDGVYDDATDLYTGNTFGFATHSVNYQCETTFTVENDTITAYSYRGNDCKQ